LKIDNNYSALSHATQKEETDFQIYVYATIIDIDDIYMSFHLSCVKYSILLISDVVLIVVSPLFTFNIKLKHETLM